MIQRSHILAEIKRTAGANGGVPLGKGRFQTETGIKETDWSGRYWARWSDALKEAGFSPNRLQAAFSDDFLLEKLAALVEELGHVPVTAEIRLKAREDESFPSHNTFARFGSKASLVAKLAAFCAATGSHAEALAICGPPGEAGGAENSRSAVEVVGFVYLLKAGRHYKVGRSNSIDRRERELAIQLPDKASRVHAIKTDDPVGIEAYWHRRFADRRKNGEWFELTAQDVAAFRRRRFM